MILEGKTVIVSGVGDGLGFEVARLALRDGANVVLGARNADRLAAAATKLDPSGDRVAHCPTDVADASRCEALAAAAVERFGSIDALVQVAALDSLFGGVQQTSEEDWARSFAVNVTGTAAMVRAVAPRLSEAGGGSIVLIGSQSMFLPQVQQIAYASSKGALETAMRFMATELGPDKIRVNMVVPTWMWGPAVQGYVAHLAKSQGVTEDEILAGITARMPLGEIPADDDVAEAVVFLCSDRARMITGQSLLVNAGELMR